MSREPTIFLRRGRPVSANKSVPERYKEDLRTAYLGAGGARRRGDSYGAVYWFVRRYDPTVHPDADNISKPVWDALEGIAYGDDKSVKMRFAAIIDLRSGASDISIEGLDLTDLPSDILAALSSLLAVGQDDFLYVELGAADTSMLAFNLMAKAFR